MKQNTIIKNCLLFSFALVLSACGGNDFSDPVGDAYSSGDADFTKYVAIGDSLTAGYADQTLYRLGQENSLPSILSQKFALADGGVFTQPLVNDNIGGYLIGGKQVGDKRLLVDAITTEIGEIDGESTTEATHIIAGPFNNMGVPGAKSFHLLSDTYGNASAFPNANPYFVRMASSPNSTILGDAVMQQATFFTLWIGNNDILSYASSGGDGIDQTGNTDPSSYGENDITDPNVFAATYQSIVSAMGDAKGVVINLPQISSIPYFTTIPVQSIPITEQATADAINASYATYNSALDQLVGVVPGFTQDEADLRKISFMLGANAPVILDEDLTPLTSVNPALTNMRQATSEDYLPLTSLEVLGSLADPNNENSIIGIGVPLSDEFVLTKTEEAQVETARAAYNTTIKAIAYSNENVAFLDAASLLEQVASTTGFDYGSGIITSEFVTGNAFSLDGVHPTARGYAVIANSVLELIEKEFSAKLPKANPHDYPSIYIK